MCLSIYGLLYCLPIHIVKSVLTTSHSPNDHFTCDISLIRHLTPLHIFLLFLDCHDFVYTWNLLRTNNKHSSMNETKHGTALFVQYM